jgi:hypothetical protein
VARSGWPDVLASRAASARNSGAYGGLVLPIVDSFQDALSQSQVSTKTALARIW